MDPGQLISFEGLDGAGKTTQIELLENWLKRHGISYVRTREPGGTHLGVEVRHLLLNRPELAIVPLAEAFLFQADRAQHFATVVLPALQNGILVITDRSLDASIAYQGYARGIGAELIEQLSLLATQGRVPDLTILLDLSPSQVHMRTDVTSDRNHEVEEEDGVPSQLRLPLFPDVASRDEQNRFDIEVERFHRLVREGFLKLADSHPDRIKKINASLPKRRIHKEIVKLVEPLLTLPR